MAQSTQSHTVAIKILLNDLGDPLRYEIDQVTLAEGKMPESDELAAQPHFDCLQCQSRYFISPTIVKIASQVVEIKEEPELDLFDVEKVEEIKSEEIKEEDFDDEDIVEIELISDNAEIDPNVNELSIKTEPSEENASSPVKDQFTCSICSTIVRTKCNLIKHKRIMHQKEFRKCEVCNWSQKCTKAEYHLHLWRSHSKLPIKNCPEVKDFNGADYRCVYCEDQKVFTSFDKLKYHLGYSHKKYNLCKSCPKAYTGRAQLEKHFKLVHEKKSLYQCEVCNWTRECTKAEYHEHLRRRHLKLRTEKYPEVKNFNGVDFPCVYCKVQKVFKSFDELKDHLKSSHRKLYLCEICPKGYTARLHLDAHIKLVHEKQTVIVPKFDEPVKGKSDILIRLCSDGLHVNSDEVKEKDTLEATELSAKNEESPKVLNENRFQIDHCNLKPVVPLVGIDSMVTMIGFRNCFRKKKINTYEKPFICDICNVSFRRRVYIYRHMNVHLGKRYFCSECPKSFSFKPYLKEHKKIAHWGEPKKPLLKCDMCPAAYKKKHNLRYHIASTHLGERHTCEECSKQFTVKHILNQHKKKYHQRTQLLSCETCTWSQTCTRAELHSHIRRNHPNAFINGFNPIVEDFNGVDYPCIYCEPKTVKTSFKKLKDHLRSVHARKFVCTICPNARATPEALKRHIVSAHKNMIQN